METARSEASEYTAWMNTHGYVATLYHFSTALNDYGPESSRTTYAPATRSNTPAGSSGTMEAWPNIPGRHHRVLRGLTATARQACQGWPRAGHIRQRGIRRTTWRATTRAKVKPNVTRT